MEEKNSTWRSSPTPEWGWASSCHWCVHRWVCACVYACICGVRICGLCIYVFLYWCVAVCAHWRGLLIPWQQNYLNTLNNATLKKTKKQTLSHSHTHTHEMAHTGRPTHTHTRTLFVIWHVICENKPQSGHCDRGDSSCLSASTARCLPQ